MPKRVEYLLAFFDVFGYNSGSSKLSRSRRTACFIYAVHVLFAVFFTLYKIRLILQLISLPIIELINVILQYSAAIYFYWFIVFDSICYGCEHRNFWKIVEKMTDFNDNQRNIVIWNFLWKYLIYLFMTIWSFVAYALSIDQVSEYIYVYHILIKSCEIRMIYYIFCVEVLCNQLETIHNELKHNKKVRHFWINSNGFQRNRESYSSIYEMKNSLNIVFGLSQVAGVSYCFYMVLTVFNWIFTHFNELLAVLTISNFNANDFKCSIKVSYLLTAIF